MSNLSVLFQLKLTTLKNTFKRLAGKAPIELATLLVFFAIAGGGLFAFFFYSFRFFKGQEPFGPILIEETFYILNFALFTMLFISSGIAAYAALFQSKENAFLITKPLRWSDIYFIKLIEVLWYSSWSILFIVIPFMTSFALTRGLHPVLFPLYSFMFYVPFVFLTGMLGMLTATLLIWLLPGKKQQRAALLILVIAIGVWFTKTTPQFVKEQGSVAGIMTGYLPNVAIAKSPLLPSYWLSKGLLLTASKEGSKMLKADEGAFYLLVLVANALFFMVPSLSVSSKLYPISYLKAEDHGEVLVAKRVRSTFFEKIVDALPWPSKPAMAFLEKDLKTFARDPAEWSQLIIFFGLLLFYFANLKNFHFNVLKDLWKHMVFVLNAVGTYIVLSSFSMRVIFPMLSLEGNRSWIFATAPIRPASLLLEKFFLGTFFSSILTLPLIYLSGKMLEVSHSLVIWITGLGFFVCIALTGLSVGLGAKFINLKADNTAAIISGFGGSMLLATHLFYLASVGAFLAVSQTPQVYTFGMMAFYSLLVAAIPLKIGSAYLKQLEY